jgi:hypothetical protein
MRSNYEIVSSAIGDIFIDISSILCPVISCSITKSCDISHYGFGDIGRTNYSGTIEICDRQLPILKILEDHKTEFDLYICNNNMYVKLNGRCKMTGYQYDQSSAKVDFVALSGTEEIKDGSKEISNGLYQSVNEDTGRSLHGTGWTVWE